MKREELDRKIEDRRREIEHLRQYVKCEACGQMVHPDNLGQNESWGVFCKNCIRGAER